MLTLSPDELLTTTRAVRKRLDLESPVEPALIAECLEVAQQAPSAGNREGYHFVVVTDSELRRGLADIYRRAIVAGYGGELPRDEAARRAAAAAHGSGREAEYQRIIRSVVHLADHLQNVPVHVVPCVAALPGDTPIRGFDATTRWGSVMQVIWSFMLAARARSLGTVWTTAHLRHEREASELLGIPHAEYMQAGLIPVAYTLGTNFKPGPRRPLDAVTHWDRW